MTPMYSETVLYPFLDKTFADYDAINQHHETGHTNLTYFITRHRYEWNYFKDYLKRTYPGLEGSIYWEVVNNLEHGERLHFAEGLTFEEKKMKDDLEWEVQLWFSYRYQPAGRTMRGIMTYMNMYKWLARVNFPTLDALEGTLTRIDTDRGLTGGVIKEAKNQLKKFAELKKENELEHEFFDRITNDVYTLKAKTKFEYVFGHQEFGNFYNKVQLGINDDKAKATVPDILKLMKKFPGMRVSFLIKEGCPDFMTGDLKIEEIKAIVAKQERDIDKDFLKELSVPSDRLGNVSEEALINIFNKWILNPKLKKAIRSFCRSMRG